MPFPIRILAVFCLLLCQACSHLEQGANDVPVSTYAFHFEDGGEARYFVLDKRRRDDASTTPGTFLFVIPGSDCGNMGGVLPGYFNGLDGRAGATRIFILHKRFIALGGSKDCSDDFTRADHPSRWIADQREFIRWELDAAAVSGQPPHRVAIVGISEGAEVAPLLAQYIPGVTHVALLANGGMDPFDTYRLQMRRHGLLHALADIERLCASPADDLMAAERTCRYWKELLSQDNLGPHSIQTALVTDFNVMARRALQDELPGIQSRAAVCAVAKGLVGRRQLQAASPQRARLPHLSGSGALGTWHGSVTGSGIIHCTIHHEFLAVVTGCTVTKKKMQDIKRWSSCTRGVQAMAPDLNPEVRVNAKLKRVIAHEGASSEKSQARRFRHISHEAT